jgi:hypothetical protein
MRKMAATASFSYPRALRDRLFWSAETTKQTKKPSHPPTRHARATHTHTQGLPFPLCPVPPGRIQSVNMLWASSAASQLNPSRPCPRSGRSTVARGSTNSKALRGENACGPLRWRSALAGCELAHLLINLRVCTVSSWTVASLGSFYHRIQQARALQRKAAAGQAKGPTPPCWRPS